MRVVLGYTNESNVAELRRLFGGAGLDCDENDCVPLDVLNVRLAQSNPDLVALRVDADGRCDWDEIREALALTQSPVLAVVPADPPSELLRQFEAIGVSRCLEEHILRSGLDQIVDQLQQENTRNGARGTLLSVYSPLAGSGATTVAVHLAGALTGLTKDSRVGLVELAQGPGDVALFLNMMPEHTLADACTRWDRLDRSSMEKCFTPYENGLSVLAADPRADSGSQATVDAVRRFCVLARLIHNSTVLALDHRFGDAEAEAMRLSDAVMLVIRPDVPSVQRLQWFLDTAVDRGVPEDRLQIVLNRWGQPGQLKKRQVEETLGRPCTQLIPDDPARVNRAANQGILMQMMAPRSTINRRLASLGEQVAVVAQ